MAKVINTATNIGALAVFITAGFVDWLLALALAVAKMIGAQMGARTVLGGRGDTGAVCVARSGRGPRILPRLPAVIRKYSTFHFLPNFPQQLPSTVGYSDRVAQNREAIAVTVNHLNVSQPAGDARRDAAGNAAANAAADSAESVIEAALQFVAETGVDKLRLVAPSEYLPALAVALATQEEIPDNLTLVETGHELNDEFVVVSSDFVLSLAS